MVCYRLLLYVIGIGGFLISTGLHAEKILFMSGVAGKSHTHVFTALTKELARRGHEITHVTPFPIDNPPGKYRQIDAPGFRSTMQIMTSNMFQNKSFIGKFYDSMHHFMNLGPPVLQLPEVKALLDEHFDLVIVSMFFNEFSLPFALHYQAPLILISSSGLFSHVGTNLGVSEPTSYVPNLLLPFSDDMTFTQRVLNLIVSVLVDLLRRFLFLPQLEPMMREYFGAHIPSVNEMEANASLVLLNTHFTLLYPQHWPPNVIEVGGLHIKPNSSNALPKDLQEFMDGAAHGVIYFSMGSAVRLETFDASKIQNMVKAFASLKQRVIWKWNLDTLPGKPDNVKIGKWMPQEAILAHPNLRLFITHGGMLSTQEAVYHGVPLIGMPVMGDQNLNVRRAETLGYCLHVDLTSLTTQTLLEAIQKVLSTPSFKTKAEAMMRRFRDQPETPLQRAVFWTEYVMRHKGADHLRAASARLPWYQLHQLDVLAVLLCVWLLGVIATWKVVAKCCRRSARTNVKKVKTH